MFQKCNVNYLRLAGLLLFCVAITVGCGTRQNAGLSSAAHPNAKGNFRVLTYNVLTGFQKNPQQATAFVNWVKDKHTDVIAFQELSTFTEDSLLRMGQRYGHSYAVIHKGNGSPIGITSRYPISHVMKMTDSMHHGYISAEIADYRMFVTHLSPFSYEKCIQEMKGIIKQAALLSSKRKVLIMGDFNSFSPADSLHYLRKNRYAVIQQLIDQGFLDIYQQLNPTFEYSFPTDSYAQKAKVTTRIDYVFANLSAFGGAVKATIIKDAVTRELSDHYPLLIEFSH